MYVCVRVRVRVCVHLYIYRPTVYMRECVRACVCRSENTRNVTVNIAIKTNSPCSMENM